MVEHSNRRWTYAVAVQSLARINEELRLPELDADADTRLAASLAHMRQASTLEEVFTRARDVIGPQATNPD